MSGVVVISDEDKAPGADEMVSDVAVRAQVDRIVESRHFAKADRLKRFLRFVTEETLTGLSAEIKETVIGIEVFDRNAATFDPRLDPIVRVQASRVRAKLAEYYRQEGINDQVLVDLPRGQYIPRFTLQSRLAAQPIAAPPNSEGLARRSNTVAVPSFAQGGTLGEGEVPGSRRSTSSIAALNQYLLGRFHWNKRDAAGFRAGLVHFGKAIEFDPSFGRAYSGVADCHVMLAVSGVEDPTNAMPLAEQATLRALAMDDRLVEAHTSLGVIRANFHWDWTGSEIEFQRALECDPSYATLHHWYGLYSLVPLGRFEEAANEIEWAERLDPTSLTINLGHGEMLCLAGDYPAAVDQCMKVLNLDGRYYRAYWWLGLAHDLSGNFEAACEALETAVARCAGDMAFRARMIAGLGHAYARSGKSHLALSILDELDAMSRSTYVDPFEFAHVQAGLGKMEAALDNLDRAASGRSGFVVYSGVWPAFEPLRSSTRFRALLDKLGLAGRGQRHSSTVLWK